MSSSYQLPMTITLICKNMTLSTQRKMRKYKYILCFVIKTCKTLLTGKSTIFHI